MDSVRTKLGGIELKPRYSCADNEKILVSLILPAYNEEAIIQKNMDTLYAYLATLEDQYRWEIILVNDGSGDKTGELADSIAAEHSNTRVYHHLVNRNLGYALRTGFSHANGTYIIVFDMDLSYSAEHIERLLTTIRKTEAEIVVASPYMEGGSNINVPFVRLLLSKAANRLMRIISGINIYTFTGMVRAYNGNFLKQLNLKARSYDINPEVLQKANLLRAHVVEIPACLDWTDQQAVGRTSSLKVLGTILIGLMSAFMMRPYAVFLFFGFVLFMISLYVIGWIFMNTYQAFPDVVVMTDGYRAGFTKAVAKVFDERPYSFFVGGTTLIMALQFFGIGFLSLQNKRYFDELFHINTRILKNSTIEQK